MVNLNTDWAWPWWSVMVLINLVNLIVCGMAFKRSLSSQDGKDSRYQNWMRIMGVIFTVVGAYRSVFVSSYGPQQTWFDTIANSALLIRILAIFAELSFSGLIAFSMIQFNKYIPDSKLSDRNKFGVFLTTKTPYILVICLFLAQFFATAGVITKSELSFAIEETLWLIGFLAILPLAIVQVRRVFSKKDKEETKRLYMLRTSSLIILLWCMVYVGFMIFLNLPDLWLNAVDQLETGIPAIKTGLNAILDAFTIVNMSRLYSDWGFGFLLWHSGYFTLCVWISIFLMQAPRPREIFGKLNAKQTKLIFISIGIAVITLLVLIILPLF
ncbi:MAG: hypothetical protein JW776_01430 [Candidatus Lokiarchaeota archaeon]|nr:hypothetical protein [Candidatus Lokiarchaeota archaeon]